MPAMRCDLSTRPAVAGLLGQMPDDELECSARNYAGGKAASQACCEGVKRIFDGDRRSFTLDRAPIGARRARVRRLRFVDRYSAVFGAPKSPSRAASRLYLQTHFLDA